MNIGNGIDSLVHVVASENVSSNATPRVDGSAKETLAVEKNDQANLSSAASQLSESAATSDVRLDKVASIQSGIKAGTYHVDAAEVAKKIVHALLSSES